MKISKTPSCLSVHCRQPHTFIHIGETIKPYNKYVSQQYNKQSFLALQTTADMWRLLIFSQHKISYEQGQFRLSYGDAYNVSPFCAYRSWETLQNFCHSKQIGNGAKSTLRLAKQIRCVFCVGVCENRSNTVAVMYLAVSSQSHPLLLFVFPYNVSLANRIPCLRLLLHLSGISNRF